MKKIIGLIIILILISITTTSLAKVGGGARGGARASSHSSTSHSSTSHTTSSAKSYSGVKSISGYKTFTPKYNSSNIKTEKVNENPTYYTNYSSTNMFTPNVWTAMWAFQCIHDSTEQVSEQDIAKELEERGYTPEEIDEILAEGRMAQEEDKQVIAEQEKIANYVLIGFVVIIIIIVIVGIIAIIRY